MVDNQEVGALSSQAGAVEGTHAPHALDAVLTAAILIFRGNAQPYFSFGLTVEVDLSPVAAARALQPDQYLAQNAHLIPGLGTAMAQALKAARAEVIGAPFEHGRAQIESESGAQVRDVFVDQLILQVDGVGGDDDAAGCSGSPIKPRGSGKPCFCRCRCRPRPGGGGPRESA